MAVLASLYAVTVYGPVWAHRTVAAASVLGDFLLTIPTLTSQATVPNGATSWSTFSNSFTYIGAVIAAVYGLALARRSQFQEMNSLIVQARDAEHRADTEAELAVLEERSRIAREMHDIVAHTLSVVIAQADGKRYVRFLISFGFRRMVNSCSFTTAQMYRSGIIFIWWSCSIGP